MHLLAEITTPSSTTLPTKLKELRAGQRQSQGGNPQPPAGPIVAGGGKGDADQAAKRVETPCRYFATPETGSLTRRSCAWRVEPRGTWPESAQQRRRAMLLPHLLGARGEGHHHHRLPGKDPVCEDRRDEEPWRKRQNLPHLLCMPHQCRALLPT